MTALNEIVQVQKQQQEKHAKMEEELKGMLTTFFKEQQERQMKIEEDLKSMRAEFSKDKWWEKILKWFELLAINWLYWLITPINQYSETI